MTLHRTPSGQRGITLVFALITLVALSLAAVALIRAVDTGSTILGNLSFKQDTLLASDGATRAAVDWLNNNTAAGKLNSDDALRNGNGYLASHIADLDPLDRHKDLPTRAVIDWNDDNCASYPSGTYASCVYPSRLQNLRASALRAGEIKARYLILRLCERTGDAVVEGIHCAKPLVTSTTNSGHGSMDYSTPPPPPDPTLSQYFRIVVRTQGARKSVSYTETLVHF